MELNHNFKPELSFSKFSVLYLNVYISRITSMANRPYRRTRYKWTWRESNPCPNKLSFFSQTTTDCGVWWNRTIVIGLSNLMSFTTERTPHIKTIYTYSKSLAFITWIPFNIMRPFVKLSYSAILLNGFILKKFTFHYRASTMRRLATLCGPH